jgi:hypothetical protein
MLNETKNPKYDAAVSISSERAISPFFLASRSFWGVGSNDLSFWSSSCALTADLQTDPA